MRDQWEDQAADFEAEMARDQEGSINVRDYTEDRMTTSPRYRMYRSDERFTTLEDSAPNSDSW